MTYMEEIDITYKDRISKEYRLEKLLEMIDAGYKIRIHNNEILQQYLYNKININEYKSKLKDEKFIYDKILMSYTRYTE